MKSTPALYTFKFALSLIIILLVIVTVGFSFTQLLKSKNTDTSLPIFKESGDFVIVIDAGHGGEDAGAVAPDNTLEKDLNLEISTLIYSLLK